MGVGGRVFPLIGEIAGVCHNTIADPMLLDEKGEPLRAMALILAPYLVVLHSGCSSYARGADAGIGQE